MAAPASRTVPSSPNPSAQGSPHIRDWANLKTGEPGSAFRGISRGRAGRGGSVRGRGGGHPPITTGSKGGNHPETVNTTSSLSSTTPSASRKLSPTTNTTTPNGSSNKVVNGSAERGGRPKPASRKQSRATPAVVPASPSQTSQTAPPTPSRSAHRRRRPQSGKSTATASNLPNAVKTQNSRAGSTQTIPRKDVPPHLAAAHEAEIRHDVDVLVERVRAVAMAENRPTTPGSHIDWAGDEDDTLPDLDDWGVTTTHTSAIRDEDQCEEISPILTDTLRPLPEPSSEYHEEEEMKSQRGSVEESPLQPSFIPGPPKETTTVPSTVQAALEPCIAAKEELTPFSLSDGKLPFHPSLPPKPVAAMESLRARSKSISKPIPPKSSGITVDEEALTSKTEGLSDSIHAPSIDERLALESVSSASSSERGLTTSIHAPVPGLPESHSAPSLLSACPSSTGPRSHSRSKTEGRPGNHQPHPHSGAASHRRGRSGASSPLGKHVVTHSRNHSTPAGGPGSRVPQASRPVITGEAISKLARTIGGLGPTPRAQSTQDSTVSS